MAKTMDQSRPRSWLWLQGLACGALVTLLPVASMVAGFLLAPVAIAAVVETTPKRPVASAMGLLAAAAAIQPLQTLWASGFSLDAGIAIVTDPIRLLQSWSMAGFGWLLSEGSTVVALFIRQTLDTHALAKLRLERDSIEGDWAPQRD